MAIAARKIHVSGRVQGVFFRAWTREQAHALGVQGWVRNCADGSVEGHVEGDAEAVDQLIALLRDGPPQAKVSDIEIEEVEPLGFAEFQVRH